MLFNSHANMSLIVFTGSCRHMASHCCCLRWEDGGNICRQLHDNCRIIDRYVTPADELILNPNLIHIIDNDRIVGADTI